jgi:hypothetical protein
MNRRALVTIVGFLAIVSLGIGIGRGEPPAQQQTQAVSNDKPQAAKKPVVPKGCETGKMRCVTNDVRWQAAIKAADRRAANMRKQGGK